MIVYFTSIPSGRIPEDLEKLALENSGFRDLTFPPHETSRLLALVDGQERPLLRALDPDFSEFRILGYKVTRHTDESPTWHLASEPSQILVRAERALRMKLAALGCLDAYDRLVGDVREFEARVMTNRSAILQAINEATSVDDLFQRLAYLC